uniref:Uncharacterized protein n=1 Tax=Cynoglossus semilaevis TaxID=244447 RepID=A0A3P8VC28_CYNSE
MPSPSFTLDAQLRFHDKWLKIDLQRAFSPEGLSEMWNEMVKDEEITFSGGEDAAHPGRSAGVDYWLETSVSRTDPVQIQD